MSFPNIPDVTPDIDLDREDVINLILASIAFEQLGLSHIINAEGEKIQAGLNFAQNNNDLIEINRSVEKTLRSVIKKEMLLQFKLEDLKIEDTIFQGCSPGSWGTNLQLWPPTGFAPETTIEQAFGINPWAPNQFTMGDALPPAINLPTPPISPNINALTTQGVAALLNAAHPNVNYPLSEAQVIALYQAAVQDTNLREETTELFNAFNDLDCPLV